MHLRYIVRKIQVKRVLGTHNTEPTLILRNNGLTKV